MTSPQPPTGPDAPDSDAGQPASQPPTAQYPGVQYPGVQYPGAGSPAGWHPPAQYSQAQYSQAPYAPAQYPPPSPARRRLPAVLSALLVAFVVAATTFGTLYATDTRGEVSSAERAAVEQAELREEARQTATEMATAIGTYDSSDIDAHRDTVLALSTETFGKKYEETIEALSSIITSQDATSAATIHAVGVREISETNAEVLVVMDQRSRTAQDPDGTLAKYRMVVTLERTDDRWLVDEFAIA